MGFESDARSCNDFEELKEVVIAIAAHMDLYGDIDDKVDNLRADVSELDNNIDSINNSVDNIESEISDIKNEMNK